jgi:hypothetical protein
VINNNGANGFEVAMLSTVRELLTFMLTRKKYWLLPVIVTLGLLGGVTLLGAGSPLTPFIYAIF